MRKGAMELTVTMRKEYEARRRREHQRVADHVLRTVGVRQHAGKRVLYVDDIVAREKALLSVFDDIRAWYTSEERATLFQNNVPLGVAVTTMVLRVAKFELDERVVRSKGEQHRVIGFRRRRPGKAGE